MASRVILQRKRSLLFNPVNQHARFILGFSSLGHGQAFESSDCEGLSQSPCCSPATTGHNKLGRSSSPAQKNDLAALAASRIFLHNYFRISNSGFRIEISPSRSKWSFQHVHYISTASTHQSGLASSNGGNEQSDAKQKKEASPEECDEAVQDLSTIKAKAKAKKLEESDKNAESIIKSLWAKILGIGPAIKAIMSMSRDDWAKKLRHWKDEFISTMKHYWFGTKLLWADIRISSRLLLKLAGGKSLSRRERQQLTRTTADIFRLVPVAVFIIVPFMELLLPVFLKLFPNMLPSTFQDKLKEEEALKRRLNARIEYAKFLQDTVKEMAKEVQHSRSGDIKKTAEDLDGFMNKVRTGARVSNDEILGFAKLFNDELTLDNISRPRLVNMCKYMGISPYGTDAYLRFMLRKRLQEIKNDDKLIQEEGVESLSEAELRQACRDRGLLGLLSVEEMRQQLRDWLDLSLNHSVPSSLLILSRYFNIYTLTCYLFEDFHSVKVCLTHTLCRAFSVSGKVGPEEAVQATLSSLPDEVVDTVGATSLPSEDSVSERKRKLEFLEMQEELIKEEEEKEVEQAKVTESVGSKRDLPLEEMASSKSKQAQEEVKAKVLDKQEQLCELSRALAVFASASSVSREREEFVRLVKKEVDLYNSMVGKEGTDAEQEARKAYQAARKDSDRAMGIALEDKVSSALADRVDNMLQTLEKEIDDVDAKIGDRWRLLDRDADGKVTPEEVVAAAIYLKDTLGKEAVHELISNLSKDSDGKILVEDILKLGKEDTEEETRS
ncbi:LETM1 and EF-hand domain-containing protein 1, mitochondrial isoform X1 [Arachis ipaensis]|uniref:LETM1 and EF-hand domain-containing protein 1, mitochondrial isoform X1 n=1 Tax=Arachis ipaensis TaxID=130454 RepID=UPI000A2B52AE|nr:LETM1 and EF-hand domain-containing protein 1, mitochondrial isoform X1 [Arachis ipaensis]